MRRIILGTVTIVFVTTANFLFWGIHGKIQKQKQITEKISKLPSFTFLKLTNEYFSSSAINSGPVLIIHFHPECEHCQYEISEIMNSKIPASGTKVILISNAHPDSIRKFLGQFNYSDYPSVITLIDTAYLFADIFGSEIVPSNFIYNKDLKLVKILKGEMKTEAILKYLVAGE
jgi:hypothetical protein